MIENEVNGTSEVIKNGPPSGIPFQNGKPSGPPFENGKFPGPPPFDMSQGPPSGPQFEKGKFSGPPPFDMSRGPPSGPPFEKGNFSGPPPFDMSQGPPSGPQFEKGNFSGPPPFDMSRGPPKGFSFENGNFSGPPPFDMSRGPPSGPPFEKGNFSGPPPFDMSQGPPKGLSFENGKPQIEIPFATQKEIVMTDYIRQSLDKVATSEGFKNYTLDIDHGSSIGDGFVGIMLKVIIKEVDSDKCIKVLAKVPPPNKARREMMQLTSIFKREVYIYNVLLPEFVEFQKEKKIPESKGFYNFPKVYYADFNDELDDGIIVMEDLRDSGHRMWSKYEPINLEHSKLLLTTLGRFHAVSFAMKAKKPEIFQKYKELDDYMTNNTDENFKGWMEQSITGVANSLGEGNEKVKAKVLKLNEDIIQIMKSCIDGAAAEPYAVVNHGDCWTNNYLYHYTKRGKPENIVLIDWQISRYCSPVIDLVYFFFICTDSALRLKHFDELLGVYHSSLKELLDHLGGDTVTQFPFTALLRHLKKFGKFGVIMAAMVVPMLQMKNTELMDMDFMAEKMKEADPVVMEEMIKQYMEKNQTSTTSVNRLREAAIDAVKYGYL
ncbi:hypothetical protein PVAND_006018 [Polypedilum vanderplanki]|uniref:CHK kinase-like domain-containing protein n=1 Tax=Polypedilum vanderplanki TaxID=319348 RepID=A0A9J6C1U7_POLVA|nr:hypothetical protein PVAND_006018 [Polypedilum vanderplanki]